jgi:hypothetical protein
VNHTLALSFLLFNGGLFIFHHSFEDASNSVVPIFQILELPELFDVGVVVAVLQLHVRGLGLLCSYSFASVGRPELPN